MPHRVRAVASTTHPDVVTPTDDGRRMRKSGASQGEPLVVWAMWAVVLAMILVTYWRLPPDTRDATDDLYHVSGNGLAGGLSRVLVELNFPIALVAILVVLVALDALPPPPGRSPGPAIALCAVVGVARGRRPGRPRRAPRERDPRARRGARARPDASRPRGGRGGASRGRSAARPGAARDRGSSCSSSRSRGSPPTSASSFPTASSSCGVSHPTRTGCRSPPSTSGTTTASTGRSWR